VSRPVPSTAELHTRIAPLVEAGLYAVTEDGRYDLAAGAAPLSPFLFKAKAHSYQCFLWFHVLFEVFGVVPSRCHDCYKTAVYPDTLEQLVRLYGFQQHRDHLAKCGAELRDYVPSMYSGYFYHASREAAEHEHGPLRDAVRAEVCGDVRVVLKRACTEFALGMDDDLSATAAAGADLEAAVTALFVCRDHLRGDVDPTAPAEAARTRRLWLTWAARHGDPTLSRCLEAPGLFSHYALVDVPSNEGPFVTVVPLA
jgi:hypothetical protein